MTISASVLDVRVKSGIEKLDNTHIGWVNKINVDTLDLTSNHACVLGQVFGNFSDGLNSMGIDPYSTRTNLLGFVGDGDDNKAEALRAAWLRAIAAPVGQIMKGKDGATDEFLRVEARFFNGQTMYYVITGGVIVDGQFAPGRKFYSSRLIDASDLRCYYGRWEPHFPQGTFIRTKCGRTYYVGKDDLVWRVDESTAAWAKYDYVVENYGQVTVVKDSTGKSFNTKDH